MGGLPGRVAVVTAKGLHGGVARLTLGAAPRGAPLCDRCGRPAQLEVDGNVAVCSDCAAVAIVNLAGR